MTRIQLIRDTSEEFLRKTSHLYINSKELENVAKQLEKVDIFTPAREYEDKRSVFLFHMLLNSINYCYFLGDSSIRPNGMDSWGLTLLFDKLFKNFGYNKASEHWNLNIFNKLIKEEMFECGVTYADQRANTISNILTNNKIWKTLNFIASTDEPLSAVKFMSWLCTTFYGYSDDFFLKRAQLCPMMIERDFPGTFYDIDKLTVPADYQIPKVLRGFDIITYKSSLADKVDSGHPILAGSSEEIAIRSATITVVERMKEFTDLNAMEIDAALFNIRKQVEGKHHLTITTDY